MNDLLYSANKMKKTVTIISCLIIICCLGHTSCMQHDGYIGNWFGSWHLEEMLIDGVPDAAYQEDESHQIMVSFQSDVFNMAYIDSAEVYGLWSYEGETLTMIADIRNGNEFISTLLDPYPVLMKFPKGVAEIEVTVVEINKRTMQWQRVDPEGHLITYNFRKYP